MGILVGVAVAMILFGRFAQAAQYSAIAGQPGGPPPSCSRCAATGRSPRGLGEPEHGRRPPCCRPARRRPGRGRVAEPAAEPARGREEADCPIAQDVPIYDVQVGDDTGQIPIRRLQRHIMKLPRTQGTGRGRPELPAQGAAAATADAKGRCRAPRMPKPPAENALGRALSELRRAASLTGPVRAAFDRARQIRITIVLAPCREVRAYPGRTPGAGRRRAAAGPDQ